MRGVLRSLAVAAAGSGLVFGVAYLPGPIDLARATAPVPATVASALPVTQARVICPGPEALGVPGLKSPTAPAVSVLAASAPEEALPPGFAARQTAGQSTGQTAGQSAGQTAGQSAGQTAGRSAGSLSISGLPKGGSWAAPVTARGQVTSGQISIAQSALIAGGGAMAPGTVATQRSSVKSGDNRGLVTAVCAPAAASSWLIAGGAEPGRRERLVLTNPGPNRVTVDLAVFGAQGPVESPNGRGLVVGPYARTVILLDAIAGSEPSPVVHVMASGGEVAAVLNDTWLDGVIARGGDDAVPVAAPAREQVISGVSVNGRATLRIAVAGDREAVVQSRVLTPTGPMALPSGGVTRLAAHSTVDIDLGALPPDAYAVQVRADVPVVAAAMVERRGAGGGPSDLAWSGASAPIRTLAGMALRGPGDDGLIGRLDLATTSDAASVMVTTVAADGRATTKEVAIAADSMAMVALDGATSVWVTPVTGAVRAAVLTSITAADAMLMSLSPLTDLTLTTTPVTVRELPD